MAQTDLHGFNFSLIPLNASDAAGEQHLLAVFRTWRLLWDKTFADLGERLNDEDFFASHAVAVISMGEQPVGLSLLNWLDLTDPQPEANRWLKMLPEPMKQDLLEQGHQLAMMANYFIVHPEWRRGINGLPMKVILLALIGHSLMSSDASVVVGVTRRWRGMSSVLIDNGATKVNREEELVVHGEPADIIAMTREQIPPVPDPQIDALVRQLWDTRPAYDLPSAASSAALASRIAS